jgi:pilus assembly protein CpaB
MNRRLIIVGAIAILAFGATYVFLRAPNAAPTPTAEAPKVDVEQVLVAGQDLPMGTLVNEGGIAWQPWPKGAVSELMITKSGKPDALKDIEGSMTRVAFLRGEPIRPLGDSFSPTTASTSFVLRVTRNPQRLEGSKS